MVLQAVQAENTLFGKSGQATCVRRAWPFAHSRTTIDDGLREFCCDPRQHATSYSHRSSRPRPGLEHRGLEVTLRTPCHGHDNPRWRHIHRIPKTRVLIIWAFRYLQHGTLSRLSPDGPGTYAGQAMCG